MLPFLRRPMNSLSLSFWKEAKGSWDLLFSRDNGVFGSSLGHIFDYLRPDFHPNDHDTTELLEYFKKELLFKHNSQAKDGRCWYGRKRL